MKKNMIWIILGTVVVVALVIFVILLVMGVFSKPIEMPSVESESQVTEDERGEAEGGSEGMNHNYVTYDGYTEMIALADTEEKANEIATLYEMELKRFENGVAVYVTKENPADVIKRGEENGWPTVSVNTIIELSPIENPQGGNIKIYKNINS